MRSDERLVRVNGVELCAQTFGQAADPTILLICGAASSMLWWEEEFCERLAAGGRYVIRYDHRDTGRSVSYPPSQPGYTFRDLAADAVGLLDAFGVDRAHLVGLSMGGGIVQLLAIEQAERIASLTLIATSPGGSDLPPPSQQYRDRMQGMSSPDWSDRAAVIEYLVDQFRACASETGPFDETATRRLVTRDIERTVNAESAARNHFVMESGGVESESGQASLSDVAAPALVIHGTEDPLFPIDHGEALAREIPGAGLLALEATGHELPPHAWDIVLPAILEHTSTVRG